MTQCLSCRQSFQPTHAFVRSAFVVVNILPRNRCFGCVRAYLAVNSARWSIPFPFKLTCPCCSLHRLNLLGICTKFINPSILTWVVKQSPTLVEKVGLLFYLFPGFCTWHSLPTHSSFISEFCPCFEPGRRDLPNLARLGPVR